MAAMLLATRKQSPGGANEMAFADELTTWVDRNKAKILRYAYIPQALVGLLLVLLGYQIGKVHFHLIREGVRTQGKIIRFEQQYFTGRSANGSSTSSIAFMPIVEFHAGDHAIQFKDWKGSGSAGGVNDAVTVLYDSADPAVAMIDRPVWNWIPWAPIFVVGFFLVLVAIKGWLEHRNGRRDYSID
jgi:hypothetical protein